MRKERIERVMKTIVPELLKEFKGVGRINAGRYGKNLWSGEEFEERFLEEIKKELNKIEENYPLIERIVNAYNNALLKN